MFTSLKIRLESDSPGWTHSLFRPFGLDQRVLVLFILVSIEFVREISWVSIEIVCVCVCVCVCFF